MEDRPSSPVFAKQISSVKIAVDGAVLDGDLTVPAKARGVVVFAHGSGSSRHSSRNRFVAQVLNQGGLATLLFDLLTRDEESVDVKTAELRFDIELLAYRLIQATKWLVQQPQVQKLQVGYFGASTGAAAALVAAAQIPEHIAAVVSRGGRADLAGPFLTGVQAPTLLIVGGDDTPVIELNRRALEQLYCEKRLAIVSGATHLFEEPGTLEQAARLAREWFESHLGQRQDDTQAA